MNINHVREHYHSHLKFAFLRPQMQVFVNMIDISTFLMGLIQKAIELGKLSLYRPRWEIIKPFHLH